MKILQFLSAIFMAFFVTSLAEAQKYHAFIWSSSTGMQDLGTLGGNSSQAFGINDNGQVVGVSTLADGVTSHAFLWAEDTGTVDLGTPGGSSSTAAAINSAGEITGWGEDVGEHQVPFYWSPSTGFIALSQSSHQVFNYGFGINDFALIVGDRSVFNGGRGFYWNPNFDKARLIDLLPGGSFNDAKDINNLGHVTGTAGTQTGAAHAIVWSKFGGTRDIGGLNPGDYAAGQSINDRDEVVGIGSSLQKAFYWSETTGITVLQSLGGQVSVATSINNNSGIAGFSQLFNGPLHAVLWPDHTSAPQDLGTLSGDSAFSYAYGINNLGQVVGYGDVP
jgi:probable HAF family extracellular repeat protein